MSSRYRQILAGLTALLLTGCAGKMIEDGMRPLVGQPLGAAVAKLGVPTSETMIAGQKVYIWNTSTFDEGTQLQCRVRAIMAGEVIGTFDWEGNNGRCMRYAMALRG